MFASRWSECVDRPYLILFAGVETNPTPPEAKPSEMTAGSRAYDAPPRLLKVILSTWIGVGRSTNLPFVRSP